MRKWSQWVRARLKTDTWRKSWAGRHGRKLLMALVAFAHLLGAITSVKAVMDTRTSQGAIAWAISLNTFPYVAVPAYWVFGRGEFNGYVIARRTQLEKAGVLEDDLRRRLHARQLDDHRDRQIERFLEDLAHMPFTGRNSARLLLDGKATFAAIFDAIDTAQDYILVQFFIIKDDDLGNQLKDRLSAKARSGLRVDVLYDELGSHKLPQRYVRGLRDAGVRVHAFNTRQGRANRFQLNFRNHRKIVVVDGTVAFVGGHNVGDEYITGGKFPAWRDTHVELRGPVVPTVQVPFAEDWYWATGELLADLNWDPQPVEEGDVSILCLPSGPADPFETCTMFFLTEINQAKERIWIASPYFVPDEAVMKALQMAALRGGCADHDSERPRSHHGLSLGLLLPGSGREGRGQSLPLPTRLSAPEGCSGGSGLCRGGHGQPGQPVVPPKLRDYDDLQRP